ncbi:MAG TPA: hypothetical protein VLD67_05940 [Vicinamibacterales bacterium]|nr:hypothetical protein [Vicinamibacterales bacterium]
MPAHRALTLRRLLLADAAISGATGILMLLGAGLLSSLLDLPASLVRYAGLVLIPFALTVLYWSSPERLSRGRVRTVIALNLAWVAGSVLVLIAGWIDPNVLGAAFVIVQAVVVMVLAELQYTGLRSMPV